MVKVYLVEDEIIIRQSIKNSIDWEKEGYEFVGDASDGELALPVILKEKPDILITDIRMPFMDGLELSRMVKAELPDIKIVGTYAPPFGFEKDDAELERINRMISQAHPDLLITCFGCRSAFLTICK